MNPKRNLRNISRDCTEVRIFPSPTMFSLSCPRAGVLTLMQDDVTGISTHLWFGHADARRFVTALKPRLKAAATDTQRLLAEVIGLQVGGALGVPGLAVCFVWGQ